MIRPTTIAVARERELPGIRAVRAITEQGLALLVFYAWLYGLAPRRIGTALRIARPVCRGDRRTLPHAEIGLALRVRAAGPAPALRAEEGTTQMFW